MSFKRLEPQEFLISTDSLTSPLWSDTSSAFIDTFTTNTAQLSSDSGRYFANAYVDGVVQFSVAYGHKDGSGSQYYYAGSPGLSPTKTVYGQFRNIIYGEDEGAEFNFGGYISKDFYAISFDRARYKQALLPGSINLDLDTLTPDITDNSSISTVVDYFNCGRVYKLASGSFGNGVMPAGSTDGVYGYLLPDIGTIILNPEACGLTFTNTGANTDGNNPQALISRISQFYMNSQESITSNFVFIRARNAEFNYSCNPTFFQSGSGGNVLYQDFAQNPQTFITTVGLYNDSNELLAVAKLSKPLKKDFTKEALIRVKLDF
jgi:hypothetical protein